MYISSDKSMLGYQLQKSKYNECSGQGVVQRTASIDTAKTSTVLSWVSAHGYLEFAGKNRVVGM